MNKRYTTLFRNVLFYSAATLMNPMGSRLLIIPIIVSVKQLALPFPPVADRINLDRGRPCHAHLQLQVLMRLVREVARARERHPAVHD